MVTARMKDVAFAKALDVILDDLGGKEKVGYSMDDGVLTITTTGPAGAGTAGADGPRVTRTYDVRQIFARDGAAGREQIVLKMITVR